MKFAQPGRASPHGAVPAVGPQTPTATAVAPDIGEVEEGEDRAEHQVAGRGARGAGRVERVICGLVLKPREVRGGRR